MSSTSSKQFEGGDKAPDDANTDKYVMKDAVDSFKLLLKCRTSTNKAGFDFWDPIEKAWV